MREVSTVNDHTRNEELQYENPAELLAADDRATVLEDRIMELEGDIAALDAQHERWDSRVRAMVHQADINANLIKIGEPDTFIHAWMDKLLA